MTLIAVFGFLTVVLGGAYLLARGASQRGEDKPLPDRPEYYRDYAASERRKNVRTFQKRGAK